ncbi:N-acetylmuramoyl-L-alanine amidase [Clostridium cadaveris]|uniref:N-acetylmuramoyl-L-alanine amidase n=2 Tax=Clostridium cadaveris TaxID=1529 RepID=A0A1I2L1D7_9CLOT|nr:N-acetylmuramoyl-L-alanine amidase [Clostridium cadaveris]
MNMHLCKKNILIIIMAFLVVFPINMISVKADENQKCILIDPGHGGKDGGAKSKNGTSEKDINLSISKKLRQILEDNGYKVFLTREDDVNLKSEKIKTSKFKISDLTRRCELKEETKCDMFISIHLNMYTDSKPKGAQVWYSTYEKSKILAEAIQNSFKENLDSSNKRLPKAAGEHYKILRDKYQGPAVIVECGFLSNPQEEQLLKDEAYQQKIAESIAKAVKKYYELENK